MPVYAVLSQLTDAGRETIRENPERIKEVNEEVEEMGGKIQAQYALFGEYDFITLLEVPDPETMVKISVSLGERGTLNPISLPAIEVDDLIDAVK